jgi:hypothetical protein
MLYVAEREREREREKEEVPYNTCKECVGKLPKRVYKQEEVIVITMR